MNNLFVLCVSDFVSEVQTELVQEIIDALDVSDVRNIELFSARYFSDLEEKIEYLANEIEDFFFYLSDRG